MKKIIILVISMIGAIICLTISVYTFHDTKKETPHLCARIFYWLLDSSPFTLGFFIFLFLFIVIYTGYNANAN